MVDEQAAIHFVSQVTHRILAQLSDQQITLPVALELFDTMQQYSFLPSHPKFFDAVKSLATKLAELDQLKENAL